MIKVRSSFISISVIRNAEIEELTENVIYAYKERFQNELCDFLAFFGHTILDQSHNGIYAFWYPVFYDKAGRFVSFVYFISTWFQIIDSVLKSFLDIYQPISKLRYTDLELLFGTRANGFYSSADFINGLHFLKFSMFLNLCMISLLLAQATLLKAVEEGIIHEYGLHWCDIGNIIFFWLVRLSTLGIHSCF